MGTEGKIMIVKLCQMPHYEWTRVSKRMHKSKVGHMGPIEMDYVLSTHGRIDIECIGK